MRAILFDVDGVLIHGWHARPERRTRWSRSLATDLHIDEERFGREFIRGPFVSQVLPGKRSLIDALDEWLAAIGSPVSPVAFAAYWFDKDSVRNQPLLDVVGELRASKAVRLYIATNQEHLRAQYLWQTLGFGGLFDDIFHAARIGILKPEPEYFARIAALIGPQTEAPLLFDDSEDVIAGARAAGWEAVLFEELADCTEHPAVRPLLAAAQSS